MIPPIIHYCHFGNTPLDTPEKACIDSWHRYMPEYTIKEWNERNFDIKKFTFTREAAKSGLNELVADVCRLEALKNEGGIFIDTSVEAIASFDSVRTDDRGFVAYDYWQSNMIVMASNSGASWIDTLLEFYRRAHVIKLICSDRWHADPMYDLLSIKCGHPLKSNHARNLWLRDDSASTATHSTVAM